MTEPTKGFVVVASKKHNFYLYALNLCESIRDYYEDAKICLVTEERFLDGREEVADDVVLCDDHYRAKIYGMAKSPYDITMYIDADMEVQHEDIVTVWDELKDNDMVWSELTDDRDYIYAERDFDTPEGKRKFTLCGAVCLYDMRTPIVREFMMDWWELTKKQMSGQWWPEGYADSLKSWDQFSLWWLTEKEDKYKDLKIGIFEDDLRWNYYNALNWARTRPEGEVIIRHFSAGLKKDKPIV